MRYACGIFVAVDILLDKSVQVCLWSLKKKWPKTLTQVVAVSDFFLRNLHLMIFVGFICLGLWPLTNAETLTHNECLHPTALSAQSF